MKTELQNIQHYLSSLSGRQVSTLFANDVMGVIQMYGTSLETTNILTNLFTSHFANRTNDIPMMVHSTIEKFNTKLFANDSSNGMDGTGEIVFA